MTGATGYVAGWIVKRLLEEGISVHATVRETSKSGKLSALDRITGETPGTIRYFRSDLLEYGSYEEAMAGCAMVFHTASPYTLDVSDPQTELVDPALSGTRNVLGTVNRTPSVRRVVLTSSCAAIYGDNADLDETPSGVFTEEIWNTSSSLDNQPYAYSKTLAEKEAWDISRKQSRWDLVVINPSLVIGPAINPLTPSESFRLTRQLGGGTMRSGAPDWEFGAVDVRDVAEAHLRAAYMPAAEGRHIVSGHDTGFLEMAKVLAEKYGDTYPIPRDVMPKWLVQMVAPMVNKSLTPRNVSRNVGYPFRADNSKSINALGLSYRPLAESVLDMFQQMIDSGQLNRR